MGKTAMKRLRSALFIDFDNIFGALLNLDPTAAMRFGKHPLQFLERLGRSGLGPDFYRDLLIRRAYLNPNGSVVDKTRPKDNNRVFYSKFRPYLTRAGFEVIDCPALTNQQKNAADIRIVIDVLSVLGQATRYDEIVIASSDADFTPLLQRIRALDHRTTIISAGPTSPAYQGVADRYLDEEALIRLLVDDEDVEPVAPVAPAARAAPAAPTAAAPSAVAVVADDDRDAAERAIAVLRKHLQGAEGPVKLSEIGQVIQHGLGRDIVRANNWFGHGTLSDFIANVDDGGLRIDGQVVWDSNRHEAPGLDMPQPIEQLSAITDMPSLPRDRWPVVFEVLSEYAATHEFRLGEATMWSRDQLNERGLPVSRRAIGLVVRGAMYGGVRLDADPPPSADEIRDGFCRGTVERARSSGLDIDDADQTALSNWLAGTID